MSEYKQKFIEKLNETISNLDYKVANNHKILLDLFDTQDKKNIYGRMFNGLEKSYLNGVNKNKEQIEILGELLKKIESPNTFIVELLEKDKYYKNNNIEHTDLKNIIILSLKNPQISGINSITSLDLLRDIYSEKSIKDKINTITEGINTKPLIEKINNIDLEKIDQDKIKELREITKIIKDTSEINKDNQGKIKEIEEMINKIEEKVEVEILEKDNEKEKEKDMNFKFD